MYFYGWDPTMIIVLPGLLLSLLASWMVRSTFSKYADVSSRGGIPASVMAADMLRRAGVMNVSVERVAGHLSDHYDPREQRLSLSQEVYGSSSLSALGVAAHEVGHAIQHQEGYMPLALRNAFVPVANIGSNAAVPLFFLGMLLSWQPLMWVGILAFSLAVLFYLITLPVELNASKRALLLLEQGGYLQYDENRYAAKVLRAAAWTYIASALMAILQLLRLVLLAGGGRRRD